jgi:transmembrane sensor
VEIRLPKPRWMVRRDAAGWLARLQSGRDPDVERKFHRWRDRDPRNAEAFERVSRSYRQAGLLRESPMASSPGHHPSIRKAEWSPSRALAAAAAILVLAPIGVLLLRSVGQPVAGTDAVMLTTGVGEIRQVALADGSKVTLDTSTKVELRLGRSQRTARVRYGRARFQIAEAGAPFVVETDKASVTAARGVIDVEQGASHDRVQVIAGAADVRESGSGKGSMVAALGAGERVTVSNGGAEQKRVAMPGPDWTRGMLQFDGTPLVEAVALANRYSERHIVLLGGLERLRVTGAFRAGDTEGLARALAAAFRLSLLHRPDGALVLSRRAEPEK